MVLVLALSLAGLVAAPPAQAQPAVPDETVQARLVWSAMVALDNANRTGDYSVLRALGSPDFQARNSPDSLAQTFAGLRERRVDVGRAVLGVPSYYQPPGYVGEGLLRLRGGFEFRPRSLRFDIVFQQVDGGWRIHGLSVAEMASDAPR